MADVVRAELARGGDGGGQGEGVAVLAPGHAEPGPAAAGADHADKPRLLASVWGQRRHAELPMEP